MRKSIVTVTSQGRLVTVKVNNFAAKRRKYLSDSIRGQITEFSRKSRKRLLDLVARIRMVGRVSFITVTYGQVWPEPQQAKLHLRELIRRITRNNPSTFILWRQEFQERGASHFHLIVFNAPFIPKLDLAVLWLSIIGNEYADNTLDGHGRHVLVELPDGSNIAPPFTRIEAVRTPHQLTAYVSKYVGKRDSGFNSAPYLHTEAGEVLPIPSGRHWGIVNREAITWHTIVETRHEFGEWFSHFVHTCGFTWKRCWLSKWTASFTLYCDSANHFIQLALSYSELYNSQDVDTSLPHGYAIVT